MTFYACRHCGNIICYATNSGVPVVCCGEKMAQMEPGTVDASREKHVPVVQRQGDMVTVTVGSQAHPMAEEHHIGWIALATQMGDQLVELNHTGTHQAQFMLLPGDEVAAVYAWCNLHGLWKA